MVTRFSMDTQDNRMCKTEPVFSTVDYNTHCANDEDCFGVNTHRANDEDCFGDILNMLDFPMESLEGDGFAEDWASKLGPIPTEVFKEVIPPPAPQVVGADNFGSYADPPFHHPVLNNKSCQEQNVMISQLRQKPAYVESNKLYPLQVPFEAPSPNSVLESRSSSSNNKGVSFGTEIPVPVRIRAKRMRPTTNPWLMSHFMGHPNKGKKIHVETKRSVEVPGIKKCAHCEITKTPQWREGPMGPKTLCNACGVRYRSGRLYPEYRPALSPTFVPSLHSNSHRKVIEMRQKAVM
ncbi:GATA transcription factor 11-like [Bidens hawaiensis]|uniref:GATA transcription factor 11-like n=1 Tax=Bidens hawaiensis TaxID=980011 RepID=UPI00404A10EC